jgi:hypothetical protein
MQIVSGKWTVNVRFNRPPELSVTPMLAEARSMRRAKGNP